MTAEQAVVHNRRRTAAEIERVVEAFAKSGLNRTQFCQREGLTLGTLHRYLKRTSQATTERSEGGLVAVELCGAPAGTREAVGGLTVVLRGGRRIEVGRGFEEAVLRRLVYALERA